jgi:hypothetical protein
MNRKNLLAIGNKVASLWGGSCYDIRINRKDKEVVFDCIEKGERFYTALSFSEIKEQYGLDLSKQQLNQER